MSYTDGSAMNGVYLDPGRLDAIFLDLDDTIVDYRNSCIAGLSRVREVVPELVDVELDDLELDFREILRKNLPDLFDGKLTVDQERVLRITEILMRHNVKTDQQIVERCDSAFMEGFWDARALMEGAIELLERCHSTGIPVVIITNGNPAMQMRTLKMLDIDSYIDHLLTPETSMELKPNTALFERALSLTGADRNRVMMIGDTWQHDIMGAMNAGIYPIWVNGRGIARPGETEVVEIRSLMELNNNSHGGV